MNTTALPATRALFREDASLQETEATVTSADERGVQLDATVFYPMGGGQAGDAGTLTRLSDGAVFTISDTRKGNLAEDAPDTILHLLAVEAQVDTNPADATPAPLQAGDKVLARINPERRRAHMRFHTATHLLCALVPHPVDGCSITSGYARLDFHTNEPLDKAALNEGLARLVAGAHPVSLRWISDEELDANPQLVRSMSVQPPRGSGRVRLVEVQGVDLQPCGGTHVANTADIGAVVVTKIEKKSAMTRRVVLGFA